MQVRDSIELSGLIAIHGRRFLWRRERLAGSGIQEYWSASKSRLERWIVELDRARLTGLLTEPIWRRVQPVIEEILTTELLTRMWTAIACEYDRRHGASYVSPVVRSALLGHLDARSRALQLIALACDAEIDGSDEANRHRRRCERWTDLLLAYLLPDCNLTGFAFDSRRVCDFAEDLPDSNETLGVAGTWKLLQASLVSAFAAHTDRRGFNADLNSRIVSSVTSCFRPELFETNGRIRSLWMQRMLHTAADTQAMLDELILEDGPESTTTIIEELRQHKRIDNRR